jgi:hypothetical protein
VSVRATFGDRPVCFVARPRWFGALRLEDGVKHGATTVKRSSAAALGCLLTLAMMAPTVSAAKGDRGIVIPHFVDETSRAGISHVYEATTSSSSAVAAFDCDADGLAELYFAGGSSPAALYHNDSVIGGRLRFTQLADPATDLASVTGAYPLDIDGDRVTDLAVLRHGENVLLRGLGDCRFQRANEAWSFDGEDLWTTPFSAKGGSEALLTLFRQLRGRTERADPALFDNEVVRPGTSGTAYGTATPLTPGWCPLSMLFSDWDRSGRVDLRVSNDRHYYSEADGEEQLWRVAPGEGPHLYTRDDGWQPLQIWGMGIASHDLTGDGYPEFPVDPTFPTLEDGPTSRPFATFPSSAR